MFVQSYKYGNDTNKKSVIDLSNRIIKNYN